MTNRTNGTNKNRTNSLIPPHGGYRKLKSYQAAEVVYDFTVAFCKTYLSYKTYGSYTRTVDQMVQAARSGKQNIAEGSVDSGTSKKTELKLVGVARGSLEELLLDFEDFLRQKGLKLWGKNDPRAKEIRALAYKSDKSYKTYETYMSSPEAAANAAICLIHQANFLLDKQLQSLEKEFLEKGGFTERLYKYRSNKSNGSCKTYIVALFALASLALAAPASAANSSIFTISAWVKPATSTAAKAIVAKAEEMRLVTDGSGNPVCQIKNTTWQTAATSSVAISLNSWSYVTCSYDKATLKIFVNGTQTGSTALTVAADDTAAALKFGTDDSDASAYGEFAGVLDDIKFYNYARAPSQIAEDYAAGAGRKQPIAHWKFDEGYGITANNSGIGGSALNGTLTTMSSPATATSGWTDSGKMGKALVFDGVDDYVATPFVCNFGTGNFTFELWAKPTVLAGNHRMLIVNRTLDTCQFGLDNGGLNAGMWFWWINSGGTNVTSGALSWNLNAWYHLVMIRDGTTIRFYRNGALVASPTGGNGNITATTPVDIGFRSSNSSHPWNGSIDDVKIYNYALTEDEVREEYNSGVTTKLGSTGTTSAGAPDNSANREYCVPGDTSTCNPPVARWNFDEKTGTSANDISGNANTGTLGGGTESYRPTWVSGKVGGGLSFDGVDDYVNAGTTNLSAGATTIGMWVKPNVSQSKGLVGLKIGSGMIVYQGAAGVTDAAMFGFRGEHEIHSPANSVIVGSWNHLVFIWDGNNEDLVTSYKIFINGIQQSVTRISTLIGGSTGGNYIGNEEGSVNFSGSIDEVRIYNYARTPAQVAWDYNRGKPVAEWKFDECQGATAYDSSGNGNNGAITIGATVPQSALGTCADGLSTSAWYNGRTGKYTSAMSFDGADDYVQIAQNTFNGLTNLTTSAWVKFDTLDGLTDAQTIISALKSGTAHYWSVMKGDDASNALSLNFTTSGPSCSVIIATSIAIDTWYHIVVTKEAGVIKIYLDGNKIKEESTACTGAINTNTGTTGIGAQDPLPNRELDGLIDSVKIYNYALTAGQVKTEYNGGAVRFGPETGSP